MTDVMIIQRQCGCAWIEGEQISWCVLHHAIVVQQLYLDWSIVTPPAQNEGLPVKLGPLGPTCPQCGREAGHGLPSCEETLRVRDGVILSLPQPEPPREAQQGLAALKRFTPGGEWWDQMVEAPWGKWVLYEDVRAALLGAEAGPREEK